MSVVRFIILLIIVPVSIIASPISDAETVYQSGDYDASKKGYEVLLKKNPHHGALWYNLGNAYLKSGDLGQAIVAYRRSAKLIGYSDDVLTNLTIAREQVIDKVSDKDKQTLFRWSAQLHTLSVNLWFWIAQGLLFTSLGIVVALRLSWKIELMKNLRIIFLIITVGAWGLWGTLYHVQITTKYGVLISEKEPVKSGPSDVLPTLFYIHEGVEFTQLQQSDQWVEIELSSGLKGWVLLDAVRII